VSYQLVEPGLDQAETVKQIINDHELAIDPDSTPIGLSEVRELLEGFFDSSSSAFLVNTESGLESGFYSINPDSNRKKLFTDVYARPGSNLLEAAFLESIAKAKQIAPNYDNWYSVNKKDQHYKAILEKYGFSLLRTYWTMHKKLTEADLGDALPKGLELKLIEHKNDYLNWWQLHQDAFSSHFGFAPRAFESWKKLVDESGTRDPAGCYLLFQGDIPVGFIELANANYHLNGGWVDSLGVATAFQGQGFGRLLLQTAIDLSIRAGRDFIELNVDTGNDTGALALYEKLGLGPLRAFEQYERKDWADIAAKL
jgi:ribosomal protein S18 acetylase RimI-like enzyme